MNGSLVAALTLGFLFACSSTPALSADASVSPNRANHFSVEVKPLVFLANLAPGSRGVSGGLELPLGDHVAAFGTASYLTLKLPTDKLDTSEAGKSTIQEVHSFGALGGLRYYSHVNGDSWYAGLGAGIGDGYVNWKRDADLVADKKSSYTGEVEAGYRWMWNSGFLMRVGGLLSVNSMQSRTVTAASTTASASADSIADVTKEGETKKNVLATGFDFGVGWAF
jgi:hypothetical protein